MYKIGQRIEMKKTHPCGGTIMRITRTGADIKLECETCKARLLMPNYELDKKMKKIVSE